MPLAHPAMSPAKPTTPPSTPVSVSPTAGASSAPAPSPEGGVHTRRPAGAPAAVDLGVLNAIRRGEKTKAFIHPALSSESHAISISDFCLFYGKSQALFDVSMPVPSRRVTALIGPSGCGKSTLLRSINRMNDLIDGVRVSGRMTIDGMNVHDRSTDVIALRRRVGMVFQKPNPFPMSIFENVVYSLRIAGERDRSRLQEACEQALRGAALWDEVKDRLKQSALGLSGGQQQRLCIARAIVAEPEIMLMDEPCSALDPIATLKIEELILDLVKKYTVLIVTHNMQQASRVSDFTAFMYLGRLVEYGPTATIFQRPSLPETEQYVTGRFG